jgi:AraC-like DNA-binding protein
MRVDDLTKPTVPVGYALLVLDVAGAHGVPAEAVLAAAHLPAVALEDPNGRVSMLQMGTVLLRAVELTGEPALGYEIGLHSSLTSHGIMGYGMMSASSLREAIELGIEFLRLRLPMLTAELRVEGDKAVIEVAETVPLGPVRTATFDLFLVGIARMGPSLSDHRFGPDDVDLWFDHPEPDYHERFRDRLPPSRFDMGVNQVRFDAVHLDRRPETANPRNARMVEEQCRRELEQLGLSGDVVGQVRAVLRASDGGHPTLADVADRLHTSSRTLKRRLQEHGTSYQQLADAARRAEGIRLLTATELSVEQIATRLGYADASSFRRAFQAWTDATPRQFRERRRAGGLR